MQERPRTRRRVRADTERSAHGHAVTLPAHRHPKGVREVFHAGELEIQRRAGVSEDAAAVGGIIGSAISPAAARFLARQRLAVASTVDPQGRVWASLIAGPLGFLGAEPGLVRIARLPPPGDPLLDNLAGGGPLGLLVIDPRTRQRMRFNGNAVRVPGGIDLRVAQAYGNCPKYIQLRDAEHDEPTEAAEPVVTRALGEPQRRWIANADTFFIASLHPEAGADASHRGGMPGFVTVNAPTRLSFPDYPGNAMFNTLGNLAVNPKAGLLFVDFTSGDVLQLTGRARVEADFSVVFDVDEARETPAASPLRYRLLEYSPVSPRHARAQRGIQSREREDET